MASYLEDAMFEYQKIATKFMTEEKYDEAANNFSDAAFTVEAKHGPRDGRVLSFRFRQGSAQVLAGKLDAALDTFSSLVEIYYEKWREDSPMESVMELCSILQEATVLASELDKLEQSLKYQEIHEKVKDSGLFPLDWSEGERSPVQTLKLGDKVEVRAKNEDELFYGAKIIDFDASTSTFTVAYEDDTIEAGLFAHSILGDDSRRKVFASDILEIIDGHVLYEEQVRHIRLLRFTFDPEVFQSGVLLSTRGDMPADAVVDTKGIPFVVNQALFMSIPFLLLCHSGFNTKDIDASLLLLGVGGGSLPLALSSTFPNLKLEMVESSKEVLEAAQEYFGLGTCLTRKSGPDELTTLVHGDGLKHIDTVVAENRHFDVVVVDIALPGDENEEQSLLDSAPCLELPPSQVLEEGMIEKLFQVSGSNGLIVMNILGENEEVAKVVNIFKAMDVVKSIHAIVVDPNIVFFLGNSLNEDRGDAVTSQSLLKLANELGLQRNCAELLRIIESDSGPLGLFTGDEFLANCS